MVIQGGPAHHRPSHRPIGPGPDRPPQEPHSGPGIRRDDPTGEGTSPGPKHVGIVDIDIKSHRSDLRRGKLVGHRRPCRRGGVSIERLPDASAHRANIQLVRIGRMHDHGLNGSCSWILLRREHGVAVSSRGSGPLLLPLRKGAAHDHRIRHPMDPVSLLAGMFVSQEMPGLMLDYLSQLSGKGLHGQASLRNLLTENKREVAAILVFHIDLLSQTTERSILRERRVTSSDVNGGVRRDQALPRSGEGDTHPGKTGIESIENGTDDRCFLTGKLACCLKRFNFEVLHSNRPFVGDSHSPIEVEIKHLCAHRTSST